MHDVIFHPVKRATILPYSFCLSLLFFVVIHSFLPPFGGLQPGVRPSFLGSSCTYIYWNVWLVYCDLLTLVIRETSLKWSVVTGNVLGIATIIVHARTIRLMLIHLRMVILGKTDYNARRYSAVSRFLFCMRGCVVGWVVDILRWANQTRPRRDDSTWTLSTWTFRERWVVIWTS